MLEKYLASGGKILAFCLPPSFVDGQITDRMYDLKKKYASNWFEARDVSDPATAELLGSTAIRFTDALHSAEKVYYMRRTLDDGQIVFFANYDKGKQKKFEVALNGMKDIVEMDPSRRQRL